MIFIWHITLNVCGESVFPEFILSFLNFCRSFRCHESISEPNHDCWCFIHVLLVPWGDHSLLASVYQPAFLKIKHRFWVGLRPERFSWPQFQNFTVPFNSTFSLRHCAPSCWEIHGSPPNWAKKLLLEDALIQLFIRGSRIGEKLCRPTPLEVKQPHTWTLSGCFTVAPL